MRVLKRTAVVLITLTASVPLFARDSRGRVQGSILDATAGALPGVAVTLANELACA